ncbi:MAG: phosphatidate cytidylyltransferase [Spirochaetales bacterium]|nr:phosphatidate cytidylyltransferase [Spirochaetales bacterium]MBR6060977.1 phosphatidate cytidylyltransferase [Spirochaetales bacterium]
MSEVQEVSSLSVDGSLTKITDTIRKEFFRKSIHMMSAFVPLVYFFSRPLVLIGLLSVTLFYFLCEVSRYHGHRIPIIANITELASRSRDEGKVVLGPITLAIGIFICLTLFDFQIATLAIFSVSFGDGVASLFGKIIGGPKIPLTFGKTFSGSTGCFLVLCFVYFLCGLTKSQVLLLSFCAAFIEAMPTGDLDNLILPVSVGMILKYFVV